MSWPAAVIWVIMLWAAVSPGPMLIYVLFVTGVFGSLQMLPGGAAGGTNVLPQSICAVIFVTKVLLQRGNLVRAFEAGLDLRRAGLFAGFAAFAVAGAFVLPRLFAGVVQVIPVSYQGSADLVGPTTSNVTQSGYMLISFATTLTFSVVGTRPEIQRHFLYAVLASAAAIVLTGLADLMTYYTGLSSLLEPFRTASYSMLADTEAVGSKRIVGLTPEASVYGSGCVNALAALLFLRPFYPDRLRRAVVPALILSLFAMTMLCTSSSAYVGLTLLLLIYLGHLAWRAQSRRAGLREGMVWEISLLCLGAFALFAVLVLEPHWLDSTADLLDTMVFQKTASASYMERSEWTRIGSQAFMDTGGIGVGLGAVRTSNWFVSILASTGVFGGALIFSFVGFLLAGGGPEGAALPSGMRQALRLSLVPLFAMITLGGTIPDIGIVAASYFGLLTAKA